MLDPDKETDQNVIGSIGWQWISKDGMTSVQIACIQACQKGYSCRG